MTKKKFEFADKLLDSILTGKERELAKVYAVSLKEIRSLLAQAYEKYGGDFAEMQKYGRLSKLELAITKELNRLTQKSVTATRQAVARTYTQSYYTTGWVFESDLSTRLGFATLPSKAVESALYNPFDPLKWNERVRESTKLLNRQIREEIARGLIQEKMEKSAYRTMRIVRTEAHRAQVQGRLDAFSHAEAEGVKFDEQWVATLDDKTRDTHQEMDGQIAVDKVFTLPSGLQTMGPGLSGDPAEDINCRCSTIAVIEGFKAESRRARDPTTGKSEIVPNTTFKEWAKVKGID